MNNDTDNIDENSLSAELDDVDSEMPPEDAPDGQADALDPGQEAAAKPRGAGLALVLSILALLASLGGIGAGYYYLDQKLGQRGQNEDRLRALATEVDDKVAQLNAGVDDKLAATQSELKQQLNALTAEQQALAQRQQALEDHLTLLRNRDKWRKRDWSLAEIGYLVQIASDRLQFMRDRPTAIAALTTALQRLDRLADASLADLRRQLKSDIQRLQSWQARNPLDALQALEAEIGKLTPQPTHSPPATEQTPQDGQPRSLKQRLAQALEKRIRVQHLDKPLNALDRNTVQWQALSMLQLKLETLRLALQQDNPAAFRHTLISIRQWVVEHLDAQHRAALLKIIDDLDAERIFAPPPDLKDTQAMLRAMLNTDASS